MCYPLETMACVSKMQVIRTKVQAWVSSNRLRLNPAKREFICMGMREARTRIDKEAIAAAFPDLKRVVRVLGVLLNESLSMEEHKRTTWVPSASAGLTISIEQESCGKMYHSTPY